jgi:hypothetical protein
MEWASHDRLRFSHLYIRLFLLAELTYRSLLLFKSANPINSSKYITNRSYNNIVILLYRHYAYYDSSLSFGLSLQMGLNIH